MDLALDVPNDWLERVESLPARPKSVIEERCKCVEAEGCMGCMGCALCCSGGTGAPVNEVRGGGCLHGLHGMCTHGVEVVAEKQPLPACE